MTTVSELVDEGHFTEERKDSVKKGLQDLGYAASRTVGKAFLKITEKHMTDAGMSVADANAILAEVEPLQGSSAIDEVQADIQEVKKMLQSRSEATRDAFNISVDDLQAVLASLKCRVISIQDEESGVMEDVEYAWAANKVQLPNHFCWIRDVKDHASLLKTNMSAGGAELPFPLGCKTDECIVVRRSQMDAETSMTCTVEVKRHVVKQSLRQAQTQNVCASLKSSLPVISTLTDMTRVGVAYYTTGEKAPDGWTIITQRFFATAQGMMQFLGAAMHSIQPDMLRPDSDGNFNLPSMLPEAKRTRLPIPPLSQTTTLQRMNLLQQVAYGKMDVADLSDFD